MGLKLARTGGLLWCDERSASKRTASSVSLYVPWEPERATRTPNQHRRDSSHLSGAESEMEAYEHAQAAPAQHYDQYQPERREANVWQRH
jgi:hypothetical protein